MLITKYVVLFCTTASDVLVSDYVLYKYNIAWLKWLLDSGFGLLPYCLSTIEL